MVGEYCPVLLMVPAPVFASPPETDQLTVAAVPFAVAVNRSKTLPDESDPLQPVQLVSMVAVLGEIVKLPFEELLELELPPPQPATTSRKGTSTSQ